MGSTISTSSNLSESHWLSEDVEDEEMSLQQLQQPSSSSSYPPPSSLSCTPTATVSSESNTTSSSTSNMSVLSRSHRSCSNPTKLHHFFKRNHHHHDDHTQQRSFTIYLLSCSDCGKTCFSNQIKSKFGLKPYPNEKARLTLIIKTCLSTLHEIIFNIMNQQEKDEFLTDILNYDGSISQSNNPNELYDFICSMNSLNTKFEFTKQASILCGQYIQYIWRKYQIIRDLYWKHKESHNLNDNVNILCEDMFLILSESDETLGGKIKQNTRRMKLMGASKKSPQVSPSQQVSPPPPSQQETPMGTTTCMNNGTLSSQQQQQQNASHDSSSFSEFEDIPPTTTSPQIGSSLLPSHRPSPIKDKYTPLIRCLTIGKSETTLNYDSKTNFTLVDVGK